MPNNDDIGLYFIPNFYSKTKAIPIAKMKDNYKNKKKEHLINELTELRQRVTELERSKAERKQAEETLRKSEERFRSLVQSATDAIYTIDSNKKIISWNSAAENIFGYTADEIIGKSFSLLVPEQFRENHIEALDQMILMGKSYFEGIVAEYPRIRRDGSNFPAEISYGRWETEEGVFFTAILRDITERKQAEEVLKKTTQDLQQTIEELKKANQKILEQQKSVIEEERLKVLFQIAGATAHELNQPLTTLLGNIDLIRMKKEVPEDIAGYFERIEKSGENIDAIIKKIQNIRYYEIKPYYGSTSIINIDQKVHILLVENSDDDFEKINTSLKDLTQVDLTRVHTIEEATQMLKQDQFELVLLDYSLPDGNGLNFLNDINGKDMVIPVVVITGKGNEIVASQVIRAGAYDYLPKEVLNKNSLSRSISNTLEKARLKREIQEAQRKMIEISTKDDLTGIYNRKYFMESLGKEMARAERYKTKLALCMMDIDHLEEINDTYGYHAGDKVLSEVGKILNNSIRQNDLACRYGGGKFAVILSHTEAENARVACERFRERVVKHKFVHNSSHFEVTVSIGLSLFNHSKSETAFDLIAKADNALYQAKNTGKNRVVEHNG